MFQKLFGKKSNEVPKLVFTFQNDETQGTKKDDHDELDGHLSDSDNNNSIIFNQYPSLSVEQILDKSDTLSVR